MSMVADGLAGRAADAANRAVRGLAPNEQVHLERNWSKFEKAVVRAAKANSKPPPCKPVDVPDDPAMHI